MKDLSHLHSYIPKELTTLAALPGYKILSVLSDSRVLGLRVLLYYINSLYSDKKNYTLRIFPVNLVPRASLRTQYQSDL